MQTVQFKPMPGLLIIQPIEPEQMTAGGIHIPTGAQAAEPKAIVLRVGANCREGIQVGDRIIYQRYAAKALPDSDAQVLAEGDVLAVEVLPEKLTYGVLLDAVQVLESTSMTESEYWAATVDAITDDAPALWEYKPVAMWEKQTESP